LKVLFQEVLREQQRHNLLRSTTSRLIRERYVLFSCYLEKDDISAVRENTLSSLTAIFGCKNLGPIILLITIYIGGIGKISGIINRWLRLKFSAGNRRA
jgi:hypothetical protein